MLNNSKNSLSFNILWAFTGRFGYITISLLTNIILVRQLGAKEFGQIGIAMFFIVIAKILSESGLSAALIRKKDVSDTDYSTLLICNVTIASLLMLLLIGMSERIAIFYSDITLENILKVTSIILILYSLTIVQSTRLVRELKFKKKASYELVSISIASIISIAFAFNGGGVWSLVLLQVASALFTMLFLWSFEGPVKILKFSTASFKEFYHFGINTTLASILNAFFDNVYQLILGKYFNIAQGGYFFQAKRLQDMPTGILTTLIEGVMYSTLSIKYNSVENFRSLYLDLFRLILILSSLLFLIIFCYSSILIIILFGEDWLESSFYLKLLSIYGFFYVLEGFNKIIFKIYNKTELILKLEIVKKTIQSLTILYGVIQNSVSILIYGFAVTSIISFSINYYYSRQVNIATDYLDLQMLSKSIIICLLTASLNYYLLENTSISLIYQLLTIPITLCIFFTLSVAFRLNKLKEDFSLIKNILKK